MQDGMLAACGFAPHEIHGLICAIFEPTSLRKECLDHIQLSPLGVYKLSH